MALTFGVGQSLKIHTMYHMRRQHEESTIRAIFEQNFTEMSPRELQSYIADSREKLSPEWVGAKEKLWKMQYTKINNHVTQLKMMDQMLDQMSKEIDNLKK